MITVGSICTGYGGLELALDLAGIDHELAWCSEIDPTASTILGHHWPDVPNLGDINHANPPPVDLITAGFPCQDISVAGRQAGINGHRSGLWWTIRDVIGDLRPRFVLLENVAAIVTNGGPAVIASLTGIGYDSRWQIVRASDAGAPHQRARWFCVATDTDRAGWLESVAITRRNGTAVADYDRSAIADTEGISRNAITATQSRQHQRRFALRGCDSTPRLMDDGLSLGHAKATQGRPDQALRDVRQGDGAQAVQRQVGGPDQVLESSELLAVLREYSQRSNEVWVSETSSTAQEEDMRALWNQQSLNYSPHGQRLAQQHPKQLDDSVQQVSHNAALAGRLERVEAAVSAWGKFGPAVVRWSAIMGRLPPAPVDDGRLNPRAVEWMMGLPDQWVNHGSRAAQLRVLGNGVVPQQAALAIRLLSGHPTNQLGETTCASI